MAEAVLEVTATNFPRPNIDHLITEDDELVDNNYFPEIGLGVCLWEGVYQDMHAVWLRWCKRDLTPIPTGAEAARAAEERAARLAAQLRALGVEPEV